MLNTIFKKWWVILIQGILMFILGVFIFKNPAEVLGGLSLWFGILILLTGVVGILGWIFSGKEGRETWALFWSIINLVIGILILTNLLAAMKVITVIFGLWIIFTGFNLLSSGWKLKSENGLGWFLIIVGILSLIAGIMMITNIGSGAVGVATILGLQVILTGIALILLSIVKKMLMNRIGKKINNLRSTI